MKTFDLLKRVLTYAEFDDDTVEESARILLNEADKELTKENWDEGPEVLAACDELDTILDAVEQDDIDDDDPEEDDVVEDDTPPE